MAAATNAPEFMRAAEIILGPVLCNISAGKSFRVLVDKMRNISLMASPTVINGNTWVLNRFMGRPMRLQTPRAAAVELAKTRTPITNNNHIKTE